MASSLRQAYDYWQDQPGNRLRRRRRPCGLPIGSRLAGPPGVDAGRPEGRAGDLDLGSANAFASRRRPRPPPTAVRQTHRPLLRVARDPDGTAEAHDAPRSPSRETPAAPASRPVTSLFRGGRPCTDPAMNAVRMKYAEPVWIQAPQRRSLPPQVGDPLPRLLRGAALPVFRAAAGLNGSSSSRPTPVSTRASPLPRSARLGRPPVTEVPGSGGLQPRRTLERTAFSVARSFLSCSTQ